VFGHVLSTKKQYDCVCPNCQRSLAAARFAPHLEKCLGMHASITRVARRRLVLYNISLILILYLLLTVNIVLMSRVVKIVQFFWR